jgi:cyclophilin family peptidyl-prolyl cis-trans isomerase
MSDKQHSSDQVPGLSIVFETSLGRIVCPLFPERAPLAVRNFIELAEGRRKWHNERGQS